MPFDLQPTLRGALVELRPLRPEDYGRLYAVAADPLIWEQHPARNRHEEAVFREFFAESLASGGALLVTAAGTGQAIGSSRFHGYSEERSEVEIGWTFLARSRWGGRHNGELKRLMLRHAFRFVDSVVLFVSPGNVRSQRAVEKIGGALDPEPDAQGRLVYRIVASAFAESGPMRDDVAVRELGRTDLDALLEAYRDLHPDDDPLPARAELDRIWDGICADPRLVYVGAFDGPRLLATCTAAIVPNLTRGSRPYAVIENVWTHPASRRQGLGSAVLQELLDRCWTAGCYKVMLLSGSQRGAAHQFYERNGFDKHAKQGFVVRR